MLSFTRESVIRLLEVDPAIAFAIISMLGAFLAVLALARQRYMGDTTVTNGGDIQHEIKRLESTVDTLLHRIQELESINKELQRKLETANSRIAALEKQQSDTHKMVTNLESLPIKPLLMICGTDSAITERDRAALNRACVRFQRLSLATKATIQSELRRRAQDGTLYPWIHISAHGGKPALSSGEDSIMLADGPAGPDFWRELLSGLGRTRLTNPKISCVFLASCSSLDIADELAGLVGTVVVFGESVPNQAAADFAYTFWRGMAAGKGPDQSYNEALSDVPSVSEYVDIRHG